MEFRFSTTKEEDAAILNLTAAAWRMVGGVPETAEDFLSRVLSHQVNFAVQKQFESKAAADADTLARVTPEDKASIDVILEKYRSARSSR
jgi:hypothetical protein